MLHKHLSIYRNVFTAGAACIGVRKAVQAQMGSFRRAWGPCHLPYPGAGLADL